MSIEAAPGLAGKAPVAAAGTTPLLDPMQLDVAILAGGLGTRLRPVLDDRPKVLAPVAGRPFLFHLLDRLSAQAVRRVVLCLGYRSEQVVAALAQREADSLSVVAVAEPSPRGTAGALAFVRHLITSDPVLVMNGDSLAPFDLPAFLRAHAARAAAATMLRARVPQRERFGTLDLDGQGRVLAFQEKSSAAAGPGWINAGAYLLSAGLLDRVTALEVGSLERDVFEKLPAGAIATHPCQGSFIDIGTPESLAAASAIVRERLR